MGDESIMGKVVLNDIKNIILEKESDSIQLLRYFTEIESFSHDKEGINKLGMEMKKTFSIFGLKIETLKNLEGGGNHLRMTIGEGVRQLTILSHLDTVYPKGTLASMPFFLEMGKAFGPGVCDIKGSYVMMYHLFSLIKDYGGLQQDTRLVWLLTSDEEVGSPSGKHYVYQEADHSEAVLVLEPCATNGALKTARKGGGKFKVEVFGHSAHAGVNPEDGANAIDELAFQITKIGSWNNADMGTTVNVGEIKGGTLFNVVPDYAMAEIDVRVLLPEERDRIETAFQSLNAQNPRTLIKVTGSIYRPPMVKTENSNQLFESASKLANSLGLQLDGVTTGGGSDGNYAASRGVPVLDGLGVEGGNAHSPKEFVLVDSIAERTALLYGLLSELNYL